MNFLSSFFTSPTASANTAPKPVETEKIISSQEIIGSAVEKVRYLKDKKSEFRSAKTVDEFFVILKPLNEIPFNNGITVRRDFLKEKIDKHIEDHTIKNMLPEQYLSQKETCKKGIDTLIEKYGVEDFPEFKDILAELILRKMLGQTEEQPTTVEIVEPSTKMESSTQTAEEQKDDVQTLPIEGESHHVEMEHLPGPLSAYVSLNITPVKEVVGGEIAPTIPYSHVVTSEQIPQGSEPSTQHHDTDDAHPTIATPASGDIGTEIGLLTQEEIKELTSPDTISQETHVEILHPSTPTRVILHGKPPRNFLQRIEADVKEFVDGETSALTEFIKQEETAFVEAEKAILRSSFIQNNFGRMLGSKKPEQEEPAILSTSKDGPHFIREKGRTPKARLIGARSHVNNEVISPTQLSLEVPQKNVSVLRPNRSKQPPKQERLPSSSEDSSYTSFTAHVENKPTPSSQEQQAPIVESAPDIQTPSPIVEEVITQPPTVQEEQSSEVAQDPTTPEANPLIHLVQENESVRDIVYNHLAHIGAFEGLSEQKQNEILVRAILFVDEKRLVPNVNEVEAGQSIDLSTLTKEILSENDPTTSTPKSVGPFGRFSN